jgi:16S rRNA (guanine1207-N2)-methyltransferase
MHSTSELILRNAATFPGSPIRLINPPRDSLAIELASVLTQPAEALDTVIPEAREAGIQESSSSQQESKSWIPDICAAKSGMTAACGETTKSGMTAACEENTKSGMTIAGVNVFTQDFGDQQFFAAAGIDSQFGLLPDESALPSRIILFLPREKDRLEFLLHFLASHLPENGTLWLVGENQAGIKSAEGRLKQRFARVKKVDAARHCVLYEASEAIPGPGFALDDYRQAWNLPTSAGELKLQSLPGAFAHGRLDKGTALLLEFLQSPEAQKLKIKGKVLDFGCGVGVIGLLLKLQRPDSTLELLDSSASALESTRASLQLNGIEAKVTAADGLDAIKGRYDWIISNPPFHKGVNTNLNIAKRMIARAPALLGNRGKLLLVCNRHLPYEAWLAESFSGQDKVTENREFKVLMAYGPGRGNIGGARLARD